MSALQHEHYRTAKNGSAVPRQDYWAYEDYQDTGRRSFYEEEKLYRLQRYAEEHKKLPMKGEQYSYETQRNDRVPRGYRVPDEKYDHYRRQLDEDYSSKRNVDRYYDNWDSIGGYPVKSRDDGRYADRRASRDGLDDYRPSNYDYRESDLRNMKNCDVYYYEDLMNDDDYYREYHRRQLERYYEKEMVPTSYKAHRPLEKRYSDQDVADCRTGPYNDRRGMDYDQRDYGKVKNYPPRDEHARTYRYPETSKSRSRPTERDFVDYRREKAESGQRKPNARRYDFLPLDCDAVDEVDRHEPLDKSNQDRKYDRSQFLDPEAESSISCKRLAYDFDYNPPDGIDLYLDGDNTDDKQINKEHTNGGDFTSRSCDGFEDTIKSSKGTGRSEQYGSSLERRRTSYDDAIGPDRRDDYYEDSDNPQKIDSSNRPIKDGQVDGDFSSTINSNSEESGSSKQQNQDQQAQKRAEKAPNIDSMKRNSIYRRTAPSSLRNSEFVQNRKKKRGTNFHLFQR